MEQLARKLMNWASILEDGTREQALRTASLPFIHPWVALMPDAHQGKGSTVGSVIPTLGAIIPACVGVDIGCGMIAVRSQFTAQHVRDRGDLEALRESIENAIPLSAGQYNSAVHDTGTERRIADLEEREGAGSAEMTSPNWRLQLGSLGSGNHFIEVSLDEEDRVWLFLHSGSRGVGNRLAVKHIKIAQELARRWWIPLPDPDLAYLVEGTDEFSAYLRDLHWAQHFALLNREEMMDRAVRCLGTWIGEPVVAAETVNCFAGETRVITARGTYRISDLVGGSHELLITDGRWAKVPIRSFGRQRLMRVRLSRSGVKKVLYATAGHRWLLRTHTSGGGRYWGGRPAEAVTSDLRPGDRLSWTYPMRPADRSIDRECIARGFVFGDGSRDGGRSLANFCGSKDEAVRSYFLGLGNKARTYGTVTRITGLPGHWKKEIPRPDMTAAQLYSWLAGYFAADGDVDRTGRPTLVCASRETLEQVRVICSLAGVGTYGIRERIRAGFGNTPSPIYLLGLMRGDLDPDFFIIPDHRDRYEHGRAAIERRGWTVVAVESTDRVEEVYCAVVDDGHAFALEDNILTSNCHHNYTAREKHFGKEVWLSRKGAIDASAGTPGLIPGSMGTRSYVVAGKGSRVALNSSPHGAGREYSRTAARKKFSRAQLDAAMAGIEWRRTSAFLDEIPAAYKDIHVVMEDAKDLVEIRHTLRQIVNVKGD